MYFSLNGTIVEILNDSIIIENNNIGYQVFVSHPEIFKIGKIEKIFIYTAFIQNSQQLKLIGFETLEEKKFFLVLIETKGIGIKKALNIISKIDYNKIKEFSNKKNTNIMNEEIKKIKNISNIKSITAKLEKKMMMENNQRYKEILTSLINFGFKKNDVKHFLTTQVINSNLKNEEIIKDILKHFGNKFRNEK